MYVVFKGRDGSISENVCNLFDDIKKIVRNKQSLSEYVRHRQYRTHSQIET